MVKSGSDASSGWRNFAEPQPVSPSAGDDISQSFVDDPLFSFEVEDAKYSRGVPLPVVVF